MVDVLHWPTPPMNPILLRISPSNGIIPVVSVRLRPVTTRSDWVAISSRISMSPTPSRTSAHSHKIVRTIKPQITSWIRSINGNKILSGKRNRTMTITSPKARCSGKHGRNWMNSSPEREEINSNRRTTPLACRSVHRRRICTHTMIMKVLLLKHVFKNGKKETLTCIFVCCALFLHPFSFACIPLTKTFWIIQLCFCLFDILFRLSFLFLVLILKYNLIK